MQNSILIPMGKNPASMAALRKARGIAQHEHSRLYLLHVVEPREKGDVLGAATGAPTHGLDREDLARGQALLEAWWERLNEPMAAVNFLVRDGKLSETIAEEARRLAVDAIIMGTSRRSPGWKGTIGEIKQSTSCHLIVVNEEEKSVLEHAP
ncbi:universal stress protein [Salinicola socius]|uniref:UspA domain-containing protein n=1 Tax=Salinicola socius TaxID=404433 RepID=A0A1Q8SRI6_9GAMM|nr:universal stress protein [Salinicola socius]OLO04035.1 hypothetical protein BTW07_12210 [Salinicola socius]